MAKVFLVGGKVVSVSQQKAEKLLRMKSGKSEDGRPLRIDKDQLIDVGAKNFITIGQIKRIDFEEVDMESPETVSQQEKTAERIAMIKDFEEYKENCRRQDPEMKARRMVISGCYLMWCARGNRGDITNEVFNNLVVRLIDWFGKNTNEWWAGGEVYQDLVPFSDKKVPTSGVAGMKSVGELMFDKVDARMKGGGEDDGGQREFKFNTPADEEEAIGSEAERYAAENEEGEGVGGGA